MAEPPIQNTDSVDVLGKRKDGGADLVISISGPLDASDETLKLLEEKIRAYLGAVVTEGFRQQYIISKSSIIVSCAFPVSEAAHRQIAELRQVAAEQGIALQLRESMSVH
jgi:hypothetical protein